MKTPLQKISIEAGISKYQSLVLAPYMDPLIPTFEALDVRHYFHLTLLCNSLVAIDILINSKISSIQTITTLQGILSFQSMKALLRVHPEASHCSGASGRPALTGATVIRKLHTTIANTNRQLAPPAIAASATSEF